MKDDFLFDSAHAALVFAFNFSMQCYDRPAMNRMASPSVGSGKGLAGLDGAAQAGIIRSEVLRLGRLNEALLVARVAPRFEPCECRSACCSGKKPNKDWSNAIGFLSDHVKSAALSGCKSTGILRREYVIRYFALKENRVSLDTLSAKYDVAVNTISAHNSKVSALLGGLRGRNGRESLPGIEEMAQTVAENRFREIGLVGEN